MLSLPMKFIKLNMKLTHLVEICWIHQANGIHILDALSSL
jgi:hypothetical protein